MTSPDTKPIAVLLVEDDPGDVVLIQEAFEHNKVRNALHIVATVDFDRFIEVVRRIDEFFVTVVKLPGQMAPPGA
jgi:hypothetical protein